MSKVEFHDEQGERLENTADFATAEKIVRVWAERNDFDQVVFHQEGDKLWVQLGEHKLNYWMPHQALKSGSSDDIEMQLDFARGAQRREAAGYEKFDR